MAAKFAVVLFALTALSGCTLLEDAACISSELKQGAFAQGMDGADGLLADLDTPFTILIEGTMEGELGTWTLAVNPDEDAARFSGPNEDYRFRGAFVSVDDSEESWQARDYDPNLNALDIVRETMADDDLGVGFAGENDATAYSVECVTLGSVEALRFTFEEDGVKEVLTMERKSPYRILTGQTVDPVLGDNFRVSVSYDEPNINIDSTLPKMPISWYIDADFYETNERGGITMEATFTEDTEWAPFSELEFHLVDDAGFVYVEERLDDGAWDLGDGDFFQYNDNDDNNMMSTGDEFIMDLGPGLDIAFFDEWAGDYTL